MTEGPPEPPRRRVLITNDDGIDAPGLSLLVDAARRTFDEVVVCAPATEQSGVGQSITLHEPLRLLDRGEDRWCVTGSPVDCVIVALGYLYEAGPPDLVLSGVNRGPNLGHDIYYSGTVGGAREALIKGVPSMALSLVSRRRYPFDAMAPVVEHLLGWARTAVLPKGALLNINIPVPAQERASAPDAPAFCGVPGLAGLRVTSLGHRAYSDEVIVRTDPRGRPYFWIGGSFPKMEDVAGTDCNAIVEDFVSVTPVGLDCTLGPALDTLTSLEDRPWPSTP